MTGFKKECIIQEDVNLLARIYRFAVFQTRRVKTRVFTAKQSFVKDFAIAKDLLLKVYNDIHETRYYLGKPNDIPLR